jgi:A/G-specific adenine glycosylase
VNKRTINSFRKNLLRWYDENRRVLPWRALPGRKIDPYYVWLSEIMLQQTVVAAVIPYFLKFIQHWPTVHDLAAASNEDVMEAWAGLGYYARARNLHKCAKVISTKYRGKFPDNDDDLKMLPGIGDYTSAAITAIAFDEPATVVDGNVERVVARWFGIEEPLPAGKKTIRFRAEQLSKDRTDRPGDFAQAMMDLGATICIPKAPRCGGCPIRAGCTAYSAGNANELPRRTVKALKPQKFGFIYWISNESGQILFERRPAKGLLGGMIGLPTSEWVEWQRGKLPCHLDFVQKLTAGETRNDERIFHSFTHFDLELEARRFYLKRNDRRLEKNMYWVDAEQIPGLGLPSVFKKFVNIMIDGV